jgi:hypothetical protein
LNDGRFKNFSEILKRDVDIKGEDIPELYENEEYPTIEKYIQQEARSFINIYGKLTKILPKLKNKI